MLDLSEFRPKGFDWDRGNRDKSWKKHKVDYKECEQVFFNDTVKLFHDTKHSQKEERFVALGETDDGRKLCIIFTIRGEKIRVISARDMNRKERNYYEKKS
jgi:uncharacterized DUF497 family protein